MSGVAVAVTGAGCVLVAVAGLCPGGSGSDRAVSWWQCQGCVALAVTGLSCSPSAQAQPLLWEPGFACREPGFLIAASLELSLAVLVQGGRRVGTLE